MDIRHTVDRNLTVIPAGDGREDVVKLIQRLRQKGLSELSAHRKELLIVDFPSILLSAYGSLAAGLVDSLIVVVRAGVTSDTMIAETCSQLKDLPVHAILHNQVNSHKPRRILQI